MMRFTGPPSRAGFAVVLLGLLGCTERPADRAAQSRQAATLSSVAPTPSPALGTGGASTRTEPPAMQTEGPRLRRAQKAGTWYPRDRTWVIAEMHRMFRQARKAPTLGKKPLALVVPHAGFSYSGVAAAAAFRNLHRGDFQRVVLVGP